MRFVVVAHRCTETNEALAAAAEALGVTAAVLPRATPCESSSRVTSRWGGSTSEKGSTASRVDRSSSSG